MESAILALLALMIGFTFAVALSRFEARREGVLNEANAIGTTALRARGVSIVTEAASVMRTPGVVFRPFHDEPEPILFSVVWSPFNQSITLRNLLDLARRMRRSAKRSMFP